MPTVRLSITSDELYERQLAFKLFSWRLIRVDDVQIALPESRVHVYDHMVCPPPLKFQETRRSPAHYSWRLLGTDEPNILNLIPGSFLIIDCFDLPDSKIQDSPVQEDFPAYPGART